MKVLLNAGRALGFVTVYLFTVGATSCETGDSRSGQGPTFVTELVLKDSVGTPREYFERGEPITLNLNVRNRTETDVIVEFGSAQTGDAIVVEAGTDRILWQWSHDKMFPQIPTEVAFAPGQTRTFRFEWDQRDDAGDFLARSDYEGRAVLLFEEFERDPLAPHQLGSALEPFEIQ